jgi:hypothetical protein
LEISPVAGNEWLQPLQSSRWLPLVQSNGFLIES